MFESKVPGYDGLHRFRISRWQMFQWREKVLRSRMCQESVRHQLRLICCSGLHVGSHGHGRDAGWSANRLMRCNHTSYKYRLYHQLRRLRCVVGCLEFVLRQLSRAIDLWRSNCNTIPRSEYYSSPRRIWQRLRNRTVRDANLRPAATHLLPAEPVVVVVCVQRHVCAGTKTAHAQCCSSSQ